PRDRGAVALAGRLRDAAPEVEVDVVGEILRAHQLDGLADGGRVDAVQLEAARVFARAEGDHAHGLRVALDERARGDHLAHVQAGALFAAELAERHVGDARHRGEYHRRGPPRPPQPPTGAAVPQSP